MKLLAIDTALSTCAAAVLTQGEEGENIVAQSEDLGRGHAERIMSMVGSVMAESQTTFNALDRVVVNVGPGSFTGLRVGLSIARGFGLVLEKPVVPVTTLAAIAAETLDRTGEKRPLLVALDARRDEVYCQNFTADGEPVGEARVSTVKDLAFALDPETLLAGSAAQAIANAAGLDASRICSHAACASIEYVARLGSKAPEDEKSPMPLYLRPPDAKPTEKGRIRRQ
ncbi:tRNA (adenosine(37)-N6)-threonylcarbamoyltransferase complex dimerization subunit type 1 TsaB [Rhodobacteraceae bacterium RKSG542]|uniref:tRNA (adenosine(37)-N6)-threonylcarbamoyltransferase complex dimerization subunit type 1 TsaB n=1 Tax=Pseudovibrio flavus TaxID=2529854 RepID=UPI0012BBD621|nr:tRNA (adenosine(37)-N6)-threonylcarbamoyltransferase complex dimerization subunit type 1 TsaB [Pseudovibrio flavus]MTI17906.1 tRNA (adenosine(37)-N6)-threonylcarbamoyltransferase complex dimerization subunit type 1 TsaB [Pseudovibrio flavus]